MDERLEELYIEEIEKDIIKKVEKKGYKVSMCKVDAKITKNEEETGITKIKLKVEKTGEVKQEENSSIENQIVTQVQKIKKVNTKKIEEDKEENSEVLSFLEIPTQEDKKENNEISSFLKIPTQEVKTPKNTKKHA